LYLSPLLPLLRPLPPPLPRRSRTRSFVIFFVLKLIHYCFFCSEAAPAPAAAPVKAPEAAPAPAAAATPSTPAPAAVPAAQGQNFLDEASMMVSGPEANEMINNLCEMGFPRDQVILALRASYFNPHRAVEYLFSVPFLIILIRSFS